MRVIIMMLLVAGCTQPTPTPTGATCPDVDNPTYTWSNFGYDFMCHYCTNCHDSNLGLNARNGAPLFHDLDSLLGVMDVKLHTDEQAAWGPNAHNDFMPGGGTNGRCPSVPGGPLGVGRLLARHVERPAGHARHGVREADRHRARAARHVPRVRDPAHAGLDRPRGHGDRPLRRVDGGAHAVAIARAS